MRRLVENITDRVMGFITETLSDDIESGNIRKQKGRRARLYKTRKDQIYGLVHEYRIDIRKYTDGIDFSSSYYTDPNDDNDWKALDHYKNAIESLGAEFERDNGKYTDFDKDGLPHSIVYDITITYEDGMTLVGYVKLMGAGTVEAPLSAYDTSIILWPK